MLEYLYREAQNVVLVGDLRLTPDRLEEVLEQSPVKLASVKKFFVGPRDEDAYSRWQLHIEREGSDAEPCADGLESAVIGADMIMVHMSPVPRKVIEAAPKLKLILTSRGGLENIDVAAATERGIPVVNVIRNAVSVAEFAVGLIIAATRNIALSHHKIMHGAWTRDYPNGDHIRTLANQTIGFVGLGNMGIALATRMKALGAPLIAYDPYADPARLQANGLGDITFTSTMEELFQSSDVVSLHMRLTDENAGIINKKYFSLMKPTAYFINTARGGLVNQEDLAEVLREHRIAGAALDVFDSEPLRSDSGLDRLDNITMTAHIAGTSFDALYDSPVNLLKEVDRIILSGATERIVNYRELQGR